MGAAEDSSGHVDPSGLPLSRSVYLEVEVPGLTDDAKVHVAVHELAHHIGGALEPDFQLGQLHVVPRLQSLRRTNTRQNA